MRKERSEKKAAYILKLFILILMFVPAGLMYSQSYDSLQPLQGHKSMVYFSAGNEERANLMAERLDKVYNFYQDKVFFEPKVTVLILNQQDWGKFTTFPVYGMPHYDEKRNLLIVASENNDFWRSFIPDLKKLPEDQAEEILAAYNDGNKSVSMQPFFDLLAIHEIGHAYHFQAGLNMQRKWMGELFCNLLLHTYIAEIEPDQLKALTVFPQMVIKSGTSGFRYTALQDIEDHYDDIGKNHARNYGWFQSKWHASAGNIYDSTGNEGFKKLWTALKNQEEVLSDPDFILFLSNVHPSLSDVILRWHCNPIEP